ncbi:MAG: bifunctional biotin--[acetyl-CoA-carboxylase] synthetase/biotin operon repressor, partial [Pseudoxanthomonas sp.]
SAAAAIDQPWIDLQQVSAGTASRNRIAAAVLSHLVPALDQFDLEGLAPFRARYAALDALHGRDVSVHLGGETLEGTAMGLAEDGALRVRIDGGERVFHAGEVSVRAQ